MSEWKIVKVVDGWVYEELVGDPEWDGRRATPLPGTALPALPAPAPAPSRRTVLTSDCISTCRQEGWHERWECEFLATTSQEWARIMRVT